MNTVLRSTLPGIVTPHGGIEVQHMTESDQREARLCRMVDDVHELIDRLEAERVAAGARLTDGQDDDILAARLEATADKCREVAAELRVIVKRGQP